MYQHPEPNFFSEEEKEHMKTYFVPGLTKNSRKLCISGAKKLADYLNEKYVKERLLSGFNIEMVYKKGKRIITISIVSVTKDPEGDFYHVNCGLNGIVYTATHEEYKRLPYIDKVNRDGNLSGKLLR